MARKNGKTGLVAPIGLYGLMLEGEGAEVYSCAADRDQAKLVFGAAKRTVELVPELAERLKPYRDVIEDRRTGSIYRALSSEAFTKEGLSPTLVIADELHAWPNRELYDVMALAMGARIDPLMLIVTTAGVRTDTSGEDSIAYSMWKYASRVASGEVDDPSVYMAWWAARDDADIMDPEAYHEGNPGLGDILDERELLTAARKAFVMGGAVESEFRIKRLNTWVASSRAALPSGLLESREERRELSERPRVVLFFDGSFNHDCTALMAWTIETRPHGWVVACWEKPEGDSRWKVPIGEVDAAVRRACVELDVVELACDPFRWAKQMEDWGADDLPVESYATSSPQRMVAAWAKWVDALHEGNLSHDGDPRFLRHARSTILKVDRLGPRPVKEHSGGAPIDLHICGIAGYDRATWWAAQDDSSVYDSRGIRILRQELYCPECHRETLVQRDEPPGWKCDGFMGGCNQIFEPDDLRVLEQLEEQDEPSP